MTLKKRDFGRNVLAGITACTLYPEQTAGPFYLDLDLLRQDIREGKPGAPLTLIVRVQARADRDGTRNPQMPNRSR
jgi:hypothetical protein